MKEYQSGEVVLVTFPFTDTAGTKRRPALILLDTGDEDVIVARVTGQPVQAAFDVELVEWQQAGLRFPSVARTHKVATIEKHLVVNRLGKVSDSDWTPVSWRELVERLRELGFEGPYASGRHPQMRRGDLTLIIPNIHTKEILVSASCGAYSGRPAYLGKSGWEKKNLEEDEAMS